MNDIDIGSIISFGNYKWRVLDIQDNKALIITDKIIDQLSYHNTYKETTWADCSLRNYLNNQFYDKFSETEKSRIILVVNKNPANQWFDTYGGIDTEDKIFLLSLDEVACKYFGDSSSILYGKGKNQRYWYQRKDENNNKRIANLLGKEHAWWWWVRTPGRNGVKAVYVFGTDGSIGVQGNNVLKGNLSDGRCTGGVRPALWLKLD